MFCTQCGTEIPNGAKFCGVCGHKYQVAAAAAAATEYPSTFRYIEKPKHQPPVQSTGSTDIQANNGPKLGTRWITFELGFYLPWGAILGLLTPFSLISYASFLNKSIPTSAALIIATTFLYGALILTTFVGLIMRSLWGWRCRMVLIFILSAYVVYSAQPKDPNAVVLLVEVITGILIALPQWIYWSKRRFLYETNRTRSTRQWVAAPIVAWVVVFAGYAYVLTLAK